MEAAMHYLGLCAIIKDEDAYIDEWLAYYALHGVERFYLYDNESATPLQVKLAPWFRSMPGKIYVHAAPGRKVQMAVYDDCLSRYREQCRWIAFVDVDEFIAPKAHPTIPALLERYEPYAGLALNWRLFGTNGHNSRPPGLQIANYTMALGDGHKTNDGSANDHVKVIVDPRKADYFMNPHMCAVKKPSDTIVTEDFFPLSSAIVRPTSRDIAQVNHYYYRSKREFYAKLRKPRADLQPERTIPDRVIVPEGDEPDLSAVRFVPGVTAILRSVMQG